MKAQAVAQCESGEIGRRTRLRIWRRNPWGFKSPLSHHLFNQTQRSPGKRFMSQPNQPSDPPALKLIHTENYREDYANSVQVRMSVWDFFLVFGTLSQDTPDEIQVKNFEGIYLSPQQAKALWNVLGHNLAQYEQAFGQITLEQVPPQPNGPVH